MSRGVTSDSSLRTRQVDELFPSVHSYEGKDQRTDTETTGPRSEYFQWLSLPTLFWGLPNSRLSWPSTMLQGKSGQGTVVPRRKEESEVLGQIDEGKGDGRDRGDHTKGERDIGLDFKLSKSVFTVSMSLVVGGYRIKVISFLSIKQFVNNTQYTIKSRKLHN